MLKKSNTQIGFLKYLENLVRCHPLIYLVARNLSKFFIIFEADAKGLKKIEFNDKINCIDVGASDGVFVNYINKHLSVEKIYCYEPNTNYINELKKIKDIDLEIFEYGLGTIEKSEKIYLPSYKFFGKMFYLDAYTFPNYENCKKQIELDFLFKKNLVIVERVIPIINKVNFDKKIHLIKIDINGNEIDIIRSLISVIERDEPIIYVENNFNMKEIIKILSNYNYLPYLYDTSKNEFSLFNSDNEKTLNIFFKSNQFKFK